MSKLELELLRAEHSEAVLAFERANRAYFARSIADRGDAYFVHFAQRHREALAEQDAGDCAFFLLVDDNGEVLGRFNLYDLVDGSARVGYRVSQRAAGHGVATQALQELCALAPSLGVHTLTAATSHQNVASQKVLMKAGFHHCGPADPSELGGEQGARYQRDVGADQPGPIL